MPTAKVKVSLHNYAVWSWLLLSADRIIGYYRMFAWMKLCRMMWIGIFCACSKAFFSFMRPTFRSFLPLQAYEYCISVLWVPWKLAIKECYLSLSAVGYTIIQKEQDPVVQSVVSLTSSLVVKMLFVLVSTISNSQFICWKRWVAFCKCYSHFFSKKY